jgi:hypothetical protein
MHLLVIFGIALLVFGPEASRTRQRHRGGDPRLQVSHERGREASQRQTHHRRRTTLTGMNREFLILLMMPY